MHKNIKNRIEKIRNDLVPDGFKRTKQGILPKQWAQEKIMNVLTRVGNPVVVEPDREYIQIGIRSHGKGLFYKDPISGSDLGNKAVFWIEPNCFVVNIVFAWEQAIGITSEKEIGLIGSHRFPMYSPIDNKVDIEYLLHFFMTQRGKDMLEEASPGGAGRNKTLGQDRFAKSEIVLPSYAEQVKIVETLNHCDKVIGLKQKLIEEEHNRKKWLATNLLSGKMRLPFYKDKWKTVELKDLFDYIQPTPYLVKSTEYKADYEIPVLTAGKTFVLGYTNEKEGIYTNLPVVIFDDFTTASKYVDFPFKVKSSAMKILRARKGFDIKFAYETLQHVRYTIGGHERHWISKISLLSIKVPSYCEQVAIAKILSDEDRKIALLKQELSQWQQKKKSLMQLLLTGIVQVSV